MSKRNRRKAVFYLFSSIIRTIWIRLRWHYNRGLHDYLRLNHIRLRSIVGAWLLIIDSWRGIVRAGNCVISNCTSSAYNCSSNHIG
jgi:hypothetical protein